MKILFIMLLMISSCTKNDPITKAESEIVIDKWLDLWATYDLNKLDDVFYQSDELTYFSSEKVGLIKGYDQMRPHHKGFGFVEGGTEPDKKLWLEDLDYRLYGEISMVAGIWFFGDPTLPKDSVQKGPVTFILKRDQKNTLKVIHTQFGNYR